MKMNILFLVWSYLKAKAFSTVVNIFLLGLGISMITSIILFNNYLGEKVASDMHGIDLVVGAKGSPLQIILCNVFHADFPTGNIRLKDVEPIVSHPLVKIAIPLSLGDSYEGFRIVGTTLDYAKLYNAGLAHGSWFGGEMEVVIGAAVNSSMKLKLGSVFSSAHGLTDGGHHHGESFRVVGVLEKTNTVLDGLILTSLESVWEVHGSHDENADGPNDTNTKVADPYKVAPSIEKSDTTTAITSVLIQFRNPMGALQLPRYINADTNLQAASPAFEAARLFSILGVGLDVVKAFAFVIVLIAGLSIFIALYNSLRERQYDLAIMRTLGASRSRLFLTITLEGCLLTIAGCIVGILLGHMVIGFTSLLIEKDLSIDVWQLANEEILLLLSSLVFGLICSVIPAFKAYRINMHKILANG